MLRAWTEGDEIRVVVTPVTADGLTVEPVLVTTIDDLLDVVRTWIAVELDRDPGGRSDRGTFS